MITGGNATVFIADMDRAVRFYTEVLELKLAERFGDHWATVDAGKGLTIGLHPASPNYPAPGTNGATMIGLETKEKIEDVVGRLKERGVRTTGEIIRSEAGNFAHFQDPDGNEMYLWETVSWDATGADQVAAGETRAD